MLYYHNEVDTLDKLYTVSYTHLDVYKRQSQLNAVKACFEDPTTQISTLVKPFTADEPFAVLENVNSPKVVLNTNYHKH